MSYYKDKVVVVTGSANGIGMGIAEEIGNRGGRVVLVDILEDDLNKTVARLKEKGSDVVGYPMDVTVEEDWPKLRDFVLDKYGRIDILFNNAGIMYAKPNKCFQTIDWMYYFKANVLAAVFGCNTFAPVMEKQGGGHICTTGSTASLGPNGGDGIGVPYSPTKAAVLTYMEQFAVQQAMDGTNVTCSCVMPCVINTDIGLRIDNPLSVPLEFRDKLDIIDNRPPEAVKAAHDTYDALHLPKDHPIYQQFREGGVIEIEEGVEIILREIEKGYFYIYTHPGLSAAVNRVEMMRRLTPYSQPVSIAEAMGEFNVKAWERS